MVGSAIVRCLEAQGYHNILTRTSKELDLKRQEPVEKFFAGESLSMFFLRRQRSGELWQMTYILRILCMKT